MATIASDPKVTIKQYQIPIDIEITFEIAYEIAGQIQDDTSDTGNCIRTIFSEHIKAYCRRDKNVIVHGGRSLQVIPKDQAKIATLDWDLFYECPESSEKSKTSKDNLIQIVGKILDDIAKSIHSEKWELLVLAQNPRFIVLITKSMRGSDLAQIVFSYAGGKVHLIDIELIKPQQEDKICIDDIFYLNPFISLNTEGKVLQESSNKRGKRQIRFATLSQIIQSDTLNPLLMSYYKSLPPGSVVLHGIQAFEVNVKDIIAILAKRLGISICLAVSNTCVASAAKTDNEAQSFKTANVTGATATANTAERFAAVMNTASTALGANTSPITDASSVSAGTVMLPLFGSVAANVKSSDEQRKAVDTTAQLTKDDATEKDKKLNKLLQIFENDLKFFHDLPAETDAAQVRQAVKDALYNCVYHSETMLHLYLYSEDNECYDDFRSKVCVGLSGCNIISEFMAKLPVALDMVEGKPVSTKGKMGSCMAPSSLESF